MAMMHKTITTSKAMVAAMANPSPEFWESTTDFAILLTGKVKP
jgi:hypothetical protein